MPDENQQYLVVVNHQDQHAIWPADRELPLGWKKEGFSGSQEDALTHIEEIWADDRPASLRRMMEEMEREANNNG